MYHKHHEPCEPRPTNECFYIECVIVCHKYDDFLRCTLPHNKTIFDRVIVVTSPEDIATQKLCEFYHVECVQSERLRTAEGKFCKGAGINDGLARLAKGGWVLHLDADIWLPPQTRRLLERACLDKRMLYGIDRFGVVGYKQWQKFLDAPRLQHECDSYIHVRNSGFPIGTRVMQNHMSGYVPIGFFQLWHPQCSSVMKYPEGHTDAGREDLLFAKQWTRAQRGFIPEIIGYHLESEDAGFGTNWSGRKTKRFELDDRSWWQKFWYWLNHRPMDD